MVDSRGRAQVIDNAGHHDAEYGNRDRQVHEPFLDRHRRRQEERLDNREDGNEENARQQVRHQLVHDSKDNIKCRQYSFYHLICHLREGGDLYLFQTGFRFVNTFSSILLSYLPYNL